MTHPSLTLENEIQLIKKLLRDWHWGECIFNHLIVPEGYTLFPEVPLNGLSEGEIDIIGFNPLQPSHAIAIEFKLIKVPDAAFYTDQPNKLEELSKLKKQVTRNFKLGFWRSYAYVITLVDSRNYKANKVQHQGLSENLYFLLKEKLMNLELLTGIGLVSSQFNQLTDCEPLTSGFISTEFIRPATEQSQSDQLTEWLVESLKC